MIIPMLCVNIFVILVVWFLLPRLASLIIHTPTAISSFVCLSMLQLMAVFISMRCSVCGLYLQLFLFSSRRRHTRSLCDWSSDVCSSDLAIHRAPRDLHRLPPSRRCGGGFRGAGARGALHRRDGLRAHRALARTRAREGHRTQRSEERRVGKEGRSRWSPYH